MGEKGAPGGRASALLGLCLPFIAKAFNVYFLRQHFLSLPTELEEAGVLDGASVWRQFWSLALAAIHALGLPLEIAKGQSTVASA